MVARLPLTQSLGSVEIYATLPPICSMNLFIAQQKIIILALVNLTLKETIKR